MSVSQNLTEQSFRRVWSWQRWIEYYRHNDRTLLPMSWHAGARLSEEEKALILPSLQEFQQGEGLEGRHFFRCVRLYAEQSGDWDYIESHRLFMAEEKRHATDLARFLELAGAPVLARRSFWNRVFCWLGSRGGLELTLAIVLMVEVCAQAYYGILRKATGCRLLQQICSQCLHDEMFHVRFQSEVLARLRSRHPAWALALSHALDSFLFVSAGLVCWWGHRRVMRQAGVGFTGFWQQARLHLFRASMLKDPGSYAWSRQPEAAESRATNDVRLGRKERKEVCT